MPVVTSNEGFLGTRFLIYPQAPYVPGYATPEVVWISSDPSSIQAGPADGRMYVRDPVYEKEPYEFPYLPPFVGLTNPPAVAGPDGHFDHLSPSSREFVAAHAFAAVRRVMDIFEGYVGRFIGWHFAETYERLEIVPWVEWDNAQSGYGFLELGVEHGADGQDYPFALNFDTIAHEVGHAILFSLMGLPDDDRHTNDFDAFHESSADTVSLLSFLHFDSGLDRLLKHCGGNLLTMNELNRIIELTGDRQIRLASNPRKMSEVTSEVHDRSRPFTGAVFDTLVDTFQAILVEQGLADARLLTVDIREFDKRTLERISAFTTTAFRARPFLFKSALIEARDQVGVALVKAWSGLTPGGLSFARAAAAVTQAAEHQAGLAARFDTNFRWREIL